MLFHPQRKGDFRESMHEDYSVMKYYPKDHLLGRYPKLAIWEPTFHLDFT